MKIGELHGELTLDDRPFSKTLADADQTVASATAKMGKGFDGVGDRLTKAGAKMTAFVSIPVAAALGGAINAASNLNETVSKSNTVFGSAGASIEKWAEGAANGFGQSKRQALEAASTFGNLFTQLGVGADQAAGMSKQMVELASDFASFHNADITEVLEAQTAAFRGEYDSVQRFVPTINAAAVEQEALKMGLGATTAELDAQDKALAVQALMMSGAGEATGDFARTADGAANQQRILRAEMEDAAAEIGAKLLPAFSSLLGVARDAVGVYSNLAPELQNAALGFAAIAVAAGPLLTIGGNVAKGIGLAKTAVDKFGASSTIAAAGVAILAAGIVEHFAEIEQTAAETRKGLQKTIETNSLESYAQVLAKVSERLAELREEDKQYRGIGGFLKETFELLPGVSDNAARLTGEIRGLGDVSEEAGRAQFQLRENLAMAGARLKLTADETKQLADRVGIDLAGSYTEVQPALKAAYDEAHTGTTTSKQLTDATADLSSKVATAEERLEAYKDALDATLGVQISSAEATIDYHQALDDLAAAYVEAKGNADLNTEAGRDLREAMIGVIEASVNQVEALITEGKVTAGSAEAKQLLVDKLRAAQHEYPALRGLIEEYIQTVLSQPTEHTTTFTANVAQGIADIKRFQAALQALPKGVFLQAGFEPNAIIGQHSAPGRASGGPVTAGELYQVNERELEYFRPATSGTILTPLQAGVGTAPGPTAVDNHVAVTVLIDGREFRGMIRTELDEAGRAQLRARRSGAGAARRPY